MLLTLPVERESLASGTKLASPEELGDSDEALSRLEGQMVPRPIPPREPISMAMAKVSLAPDSTTQRVV